MRKISNTLNAQIDIMHKKDWDTVYVAVDWHDTIMPSTYSLNSYGNYVVYKYADKVLKWMSECDNIKLILYTSSHDREQLELIENLKWRYGISFDYRNNNPEVPNTVTGNFEDKLYYSILLDDKAGFDPNKDWKTLYKNIRKANRKFKGTWTRKSM